MMRGGGHHLRLDGRLRSLVHHGVGVLHAHAVRTTLALDEAHEVVVVLTLRPVALPLEQGGMVVTRTAPAWTMRERAASCAAWEVAPQQSSTT